MICEQCKVAGKKSSVYPMGRSTTLMGHSRYYDNTGQYHSHDPNTVTEGFKCSEGHQWMEKFKPTCPAPNCGYGDD